MLRCVGFSCAPKGKWTCGLGGGTRDAADGVWVWIGVRRRGPNPFVGGLRGLTGGIGAVMMGGGKGGGEEVVGVTMT